MERHRARVLIGHQAVAYRADDGEAECRYQAGQHADGIEFVEFHRQGQPEACEDEQRGDEHPGGQPSDAERREDESGQDREEIENQDRNGHR